MKTSHKSSQEASALVLTLVAIFIMAACVGAAVHLSTTTMRQTNSSREFSALRSAAEGALDFAYGVWLQKVNSAYAPVSNNTLTTALNTVPQFSGFPYDVGAGYTGPKITGTDLGQFGKPYGTATDTNPPPSTLVKLDRYPNWLGMSTSYVASVRLTTAAGKRSASYGAKRIINYTVIPLFQATAFYEDKIELYRTAPMTIDGLVHSNDEAWVSQLTPGGNSFGSLTFTGNLSYAERYEDTVAPPRSETWSGYDPNSAFPPNYPNGGFDQQVNQVPRMEPLGLDASSILNPTDINPNINSSREIIEPPNTYVDPVTQTIKTRTGYTDPQPIADRRIYNKAGLRIRVIGSSYTFTSANGTATLTTAQKNALTSALSQQSGTTFYDRREGKYITVTTLDLSAALSTLNGPPPNGLSGFNGILYIDDIGSTGSSPRAIRLTKGGTLPSAGFTVGSQNPVYIQGDYNTSAVRVSSAVFADSVTILSNSWKDSNSSGTLKQRIAGNTTVNTAVVAGNVPSGWRNPATSATYGYSGGLNNFPRFLEDWTSKTFTYKGSMVELFASQIGTGQWDTGAIYVPPTRFWSFDGNFISSPPPGSLTAVAQERGPLSRF